MSRLYQTDCGYPRSYARNTAIHDSTWRRLDGDRLWVWSRPSRRGSRARSVRRCTQARREASPPDVGRSAGQQRASAGARAKDASGLQLTPAEDVKNDQLEVVQVVEKTREQLEAPEQSASRGAGQQEAAKK